MRIIPLAAALVLVLSAPLAAQIRADTAKLSYDDARHLLVRTGFAPRPDEIAKFEGMSRAEAVRRLLDGARGEAATPPPGWTREPPNLQARRTMSDEERRAYQRQRRDEGIGLVNWWYREMTATASPLTERMTLFWHNHFTSEFRKVQSPVLMYRQNVLLRRHALGNFGKLLAEIARDPAMVIYLDSRANRKDRPNENFARELLELFTLGEGQGYTERDIKEAARAFSGWGIEPDSGEFRFRPGQHDGGEKTFLGRTGAFGGDDIVAALLRHPRTAMHIAEKTWREFVSEKPDSAEIHRIAGAFRSSGYELKVLLRETFLSPHFWAAENRGRLIRSPVELVVGTMRVFGIAAPDDSPVLFQIGRALGQEIFSPPNVKGWPGGTAWITANTLLMRQQVLTRLASARPGRAVPAPAAPRDANMERRMGAAEMAGVDLDAWYERLDARHKRPDRLTALLLPTKPVQPPSDASDPARFVRDLLFDPAYQLK